MIYEALGVLASAALLFGIGIGPAWLLLRTARDGAALGAAIAPALGSGILLLIGFPLCRLLGPLHGWAWPVAGVLLAASLATAGWQLRHRSFRDSIAPRAAVASLAWCLAVALLLVAPMALRGINYAVFRSNPSDAFQGMSIAETLRVVPWKTLLRAMDRAEPTETLRELAMASPTALFGARAAAGQVSLNMPAALAWHAELAGVPVHRFYLASHLLALVVSMPVCLAIGSRLRIPAPWRQLVAGAVALGFWAQFLIESDAGYETAAFPVLLLFVLAWMLAEQEEPKHRIGALSLLAFSGAVIACVYLPMAVLLALAFAIYFAGSLVQRTRPAGALLPYVGAFGAILLIIVATGQMDRWLLNLRYLLAASQLGFTPDLINLLRQERAAGFWGLPPGVMSASWPVPRLSIVLPLQAWGWVLFLASLGVAALGLRRSAPAPGRIVLSTTGATLLLVGLFYALGQERTAGRAFSYGYPYFIFSVALVFAWDFPARLARVGCLLRPAVGAWVAAQCLVSLYVPYSSRLGSIFGKAASLRQSHDYDSSPITRHLEAHPPRLLLVNIPRDDPEWMFARYAQAVFSAQPAYFQDGIVIDNSAEPRNFHPSQLTAAPDYVVTTRRDDQLQGTPRAQLVAETPDLVLYAINQGDLTWFKQLEQASIAREQAKPIKDLRPMPLARP